MPQYKSCIYLHRFFGSDEFRNDELDDASNTLARYPEVSFARLLASQ
jgi:hypothetical protein